MSDPPLDIERVRSVATSIPTVFLNSPQYVSDGLSRLVGIDVVLKLETVNPVGSAAGRAAEWWFECHPDAHRIVCPSVSDLGIAMARAGRVRGVEVDLFGPLSVDRAVVDVLRRSGTTVQLDGGDNLETDAEARRYSSVVDAHFIDDGAHVEFVEGAATIAAEIEDGVTGSDAIYVSAESGFLAVGVGQWCHLQMPQTRVVAVSTGNGPAPVGAATTSIDQTIHVDQETIRTAQDALARHEGLRVSVAGAAPLAALMIAARSMGDASAVVVVASRERS